MSRCRRLRFEAYWLRCSRLWGTGHSNSRIDCLPMPCSTKGIHCGLRAAPCAATAAPPARGAVSAPTTATDAATPGRLTTRRNTTAPTKPLRRNPAQWSRGPTRRRKRLRRPARRHRLRRTATRSTRHATAIAIATGTAKQETTMDRPGRRRPGTRPVHNACTHRRLLRRQWNTGSHCRRQHSRHFRRVGRTRRRRHTPRRRGNRRGRDRCAVYQFQ